MPDSADCFRQPVKIMKPLVVTLEGGHVLSPWSENKQRTRSTSLKTLALRLPVLPDRLHLHMYQSQPLLQRYVLHPLLAFGNTRSDQHVTTVGS